MADIRLLSEPKGTLVIAECVGVRERARGERVHLREEDETCCQRCFATGSGMVWMDSEDRWAAHPARCEAMP
jgi:hypothetical protein